MSNYEFTIHVDETEVKIFTQLGFFNHDAITTNLHKHHYTEIHLIETGQLEYLVDDSRITVCAGELLVIPEKTFHKCYPTNTEASFIAFQLNQSFSAPIVHTSIPGIFSRLRDEISSAANTGMCGKIPAYLSLKQTERLIVEYTGNTFRKEMAQKRIEAAKHLISTENITLAEAAEQVGYHSYSGFWKAFHT